MKVDVNDKKSREAFALHYATHQIAPAVAAQGDLPARRKANYAIHRNESGSSGQQDIAPNYKPFHIPFTQPRVDIIAGSLYQRFTAVDPMVQCVPIGDTTLEMADEMERLVQVVFERSDIDIELPLGVQTAAICGVTVFRFYPDENKGMCLETVHPDDFMVYPPSVRSVKKAKTVGHRFYLRVSEIEARGESGEFFKVEGLTGTARGSDDIAGSPLIAKAQPELGVNLAEDMEVECWELITKADLEGEGDGYYRIIVTTGTARLLKLEKLEYSRPWYFEGRLHTEWGGFWPEGSIAQNLQGMQHLTTDLHNALVAGSFAAMGGKAVISGGILGEKVVQLGFNDIYSVSGPVTVQQLPSHFNPGVLPAMIQEVNANGDAIARVSRISQNRQLKGRTTKAEAEMLQTQGDDAQVQYAAHFSRPIREMAEFVQECARIHPDFFKDAYPDAKLSPEAVQGRYRFEVAGRVSGNLPAAQNEKVQMAMQVAMMVNEAQMALQSPPVYDMEAIGDLSLQTMQLPVNIAKLKHPKQPEQLGQAGGMGQPPPGMGADMGFPGMGPGGDFLPPEAMGVGGMAPVAGPRVPGY